MGSVDRWSKGLSSQLQKLFGSCLTTSSQLTTQDTQGLGATRTQAVAAVEEDGDGGA